MFVVSSLHICIAKAVQNNLLELYKRSSSQFIPRSCDAVCGLDNPRGLRAFYVLLIVIFILMSSPVENYSTGNNSTYTATPNSTTTVTLTEDFFIKFEKIKTYDEEYGIMVTNLLEILKRQFIDIYDELYRLKINDNKAEKVHRVLWQMQDLVKVIHEKVDTNVFIDVEDCVFHLKESLTKKEGA